MTIIKGLLLSTAAILAIGGCGGSDSSTPPAAVAEDIVLDGAAIDGYLNGATICLDINADGLCTIATEPTTNTDSVGGYNLTLTPTEAASGASLLVYGGIDVDTNEWFGGRLKAVVEASGTVNITPLTTMVESVVDSGGTVAEAEQQVATALGITDVTLISGDPVALYTTNPEILAAALTVQKIVEVMATAAVTSGSATDATDAMEDIYSELATAIATVAADANATGMTAIVTVASTSTASLIDDSIVAAAQTIEDKIETVADGTTTLSDATLIIDSAAEDVEDAVVVAVDANTTIDDTTVITIATVTVEFIEIKNIFGAYGITISDLGIGDIESALSTSTITVANITALTITTNGADTAITALISAISAQELEAQLQAVEIYLADLGVSAQTGATIAAINGLSGFTTELTQTEFVTLLRTTTNVSLLAIAETLDPTPVSTAFTWADVTGFTSHWIDENNGVVILGRGVVSFNAGVLSFVDEKLDPTTGAWTADTYEDYDLVAGVWTLESDTIAYTTSADGLTITLADGEQVQLATPAVTDLVGQTLSMGDVNVTFSEGAEKYNLLFKDVERYELDWKPTDWNTGSSYASIPEFGAAGQCIYWKESTTANGECVGFASTTQSADTSGNLTLQDYSTGVLVETNIGTWTIANLPGQTTAQTVTTTISDVSFLEDNEDFKFLTVLNGEVWIGSHNAADTAFEAHLEGDINVNDIGSADIIDAVVGPQPTPLSLTWADLPEMYGHWEDTVNGVQTLARNTVTFASGTLTWVDEYLDSTGTWTAFTNDDYQLISGVWTLETATTTYTTSADGLTISLADGEEVQLASAEALNGVTLPIGGTTDVTFSTGAIKYNLLFKDIERYELDWMPTIHDANGTDTGVSYTTIPDFAATGNCVYWKDTTDGSNGCATFASTTQSTDTSGTLTLMDYTTGIETDIGTWMIADLPGQTGIETVTTTITDATFLEGQQDFRFLTVYGGNVWIGSHKPAGTTFESNGYDDFNVNGVASADIVSALTAP